MERLQFFSGPWAEAVREAVNRGPSPETKAAKLPGYWEWVDNAAQSFDGSLSIKVTHAPPGSGLEGKCLLLSLQGGRCTAARIVSEQEAAEATYRLTSRYDDWRSLLAGYDMGRAVMYRMIRLEGGDLLQFFHRIFYFIEALACAAAVPAFLPDETAAD
jgi:hypothetical protein